jgi:sulfur-oxidizing protein SoxY
VGTLDSRDRHCRHNFPRRRALGALAAGVGLLVVRPAYPLPDPLEPVLRETFGERPIGRGKVKIELPKLAESGNVVPITISVDSPMSERDYVKSIHLFAEKNNLPRVFEAQLGPHNGRARVASRIRLVTSQRVVAAAVLSDDSVWSSAFEIEVTVSSCG